MNEQSQLKERNSGRKRERETERKGEEVLARATLFLIHVHREGVFEEWFE